ncbi:glycosyltransferase [Butyrivibrio proteoclasticus]|uniref:glycosyltransferase n=1 Tax=Butyrivibrio proteoclasticus TaxID=43305 RepID=UPI00068502DB|nr:glycosyltransferase [Butyrivibrio proteoclasticus]
MIDSPLLSIIIPVYNCKEYLPQCIDSVLAQDYPSLEIILVDDGSTDGSGVICDEYSHNNANVRTIHKKNNGACFARRDGAEAARAEYVAFVDGDDYIDPDFAKELMTQMLLNECDAATSGFVYTSSGTGYMDMVPEGVYSGCSKKELNNVMIYEPESDMGGIIMSTCMKIYRRSLFLGGIKKITERLEQFEDLGYCYLPLINAESIVVTHKAFYHYRNNPSSVTRKKINDKFQRVQRSFIFERILYTELGSQYLRQFDLVATSFYYNYLRAQIYDRSTNCFELKAIMEEMFADNLFKQIVDNASNNGLKRKYRRLLHIIYAGKIDLAYSYLRLLKQKETGLSYIKQAIKRLIRGKVGNK